MRRRMMTALGALVLAACVQTNVVASGHPNPATAGVASSESSQGMLSRLVGRWVLTGTIAGQSTIHDVDAAWALQGNYVRLSEVSRERGQDGRPKYEATIYIGWLEGAHHYVCIWLDNTEVASGEVTCSANSAPNAIPFEFRDAHGALTFTNTFLYHGDSDAWEWRMDNIRGNNAEPFGRVNLRRR